MASSSSSTAELQRSYYWDQNGCRLHRGHPVPIDASTQHCLACEIEDRGGVHLSKPPILGTCKRCGNNNVLKYATDHTDSRPCIACRKAAGSNKRNTQKQPPPPLVNPRQLSDTVWAVTGVFSPASLQIVRQAIVERGGTVVDAVPYGTTMKHLSHVLVGDQYEPRFWAFPNSPDARRVTDATVTNRRRFKLLWTSLEYSTLLGLPLGRQCRSVSPDPSSLEAQEFEVKDVQKMQNADSKRRKRKRNPPPMPAETIE